MPHHLRPFLAILLFLILVGVSRADVIPYRKTSWKEKDAKVVVFSADGRSLVSSGGEGYQLRDAATGQVRAVLSDPPFWRLSKPVFTADSRLLFAQVISDRSLPLVVHDVLAWDVASGQIHGSFPYVAEHLDDGSFDLSPDGRWLAFVDNSARLPAEVKTFKGSTNAGEFTIATNINPIPPRVKIWDVVAWNEVATVEGGRPLAFSADGTILATGDQDLKSPVAKLWDTESGRLRSVLKDREPGPWGLAFSPDGRFLIAGENGPKSLWEINTGRRWAVETLGRSLMRATPAFSRDGKLLFPTGVPWLWAGSGQAGESRCLDLATLPPQWLDLGPGKVIVSPDGRRYANVPEKRPYDRPVDLTLHDLPSRRETGRLAVSGPTGIKFSPDGRWLVLQVVRDVNVQPNSSARWVEELALVDPATAKRLATISAPEPTWGNYGWRFSRDGKTLAVDYRTGTGQFRPGEPDPSDQPVNIDIWDLSPR